MKYLHFIENHSDIGNIERNWVDVVRCENEDHVHYARINSNGHEYVDLGLPRGTLWATCNIGATSPEEYGNYYAWGEISDKTVYDWSTYKYGSSESNVTKYNATDGLAILQKEDDAAHVNWGGDWQIPTIAQFEEMLNNCQTSFRTINNIHCVVFTSTINNNYIIIPESGRKWQSSFYYKNEYYFYWCSNVAINSYSDYGYGEFKSNYPTQNTFMSRSAGLSIRPVLIQTALSEPDDR